MTSHSVVMPLRAGSELLRAFTTAIPCFSRHEYQIVCINNSFAPYSPAKLAWQGNLHTATILPPDESQRRVVNSTLIAPAPAGSPDAMPEAELQDFLTTTAVRRRGYDKTHLADA
jgi:hypothetical protein